MARHLATFVPPLPSPLPSVSCCGPRSDLPLVLQAPAPWGSFPRKQVLLLATPCLQAVLTPCARSLRHFTQQGGQAWGGQAWGGLAPLSACWTSTTPPGTFLTLFLRHSNHSEAAAFPSHFWVPLARSCLPWLKGLLFFTVLLRPSCPW